MSCAVQGTPPTGSPTGDSAIVALDIVPAGAYSTPSWSDVGREARMYNSLTAAGADVTEADVAAGFKDAGLGRAADGRAVETTRPRDGLEIVRDEFNVPHITADTDELAIWAVGWLSAAHSPIVYEAARRNGRIAAMGVPGGDAVSSALQLKVLDPSAAAEAALDRQLAELDGLGAEGRRVRADIDAFVAGYNAQLDALFSLLPRWTARDVVALAAFKADWWGRGSTAFSSGGVAAAPTPSAGPSIIDADAVTPTRYRAAKASNFALVSADRSTTGHPLLIGGPQIGYMYPGVAFEVDINSPSIDMRGLTAPAYPGYVFIGRGSDFAWTLNVAFDAVGAVQVPVAMCDDGFSSYLLDDVCTPVTEVSAGLRYDLSDLTKPPDHVGARTTAYGPLDWVDPGTATGYVIQRPSTGFDVMDMVAFRRINYGEASGPDEFRAALQESPQAFYVGYVDASHIAAFGTCWCVGDIETGPVTDPRSLTMPTSELPFTRDPANGIVTNWNEPMTTDAGEFVPPGVGAFRRDWFEAFDAVPVHSTATLVGAMNDLATRSVGGGTIPFMDLFPPAEGARPPAITATNRSTGIQLVMSFGDG